MPSRLEGSLKVDSTVDFIESNYILRIWRRKLVDELADEWQKHIVEGDMTLRKTPSPFPPFQKEEPPFKLKVYKRNANAYKTEYTIDDNVELGLPYTGLNLGDNAVSLSFEDNWMESGEIHGVGFAIQSLRAFAGTVCRVPVTFDSC